MSSDRILYIHTMFNNSKWVWMTGFDSGMMEKITVKNIIMTVDKNWVWAFPPRQDFVITFLLLQGPSEVLNLTL